MTKQPWKNNPVSLQQLHYNFIYTQTFSFGFVVFKNTVAQNGKGISMDT